MYQNNKTCIILYMKDKKWQNIKTSSRLEKVLDQLEIETSKSEQDDRTPTHGGESERIDKDFPRVVGNA